MGGEGVAYRMGNNSDVSDGVASCTVMHVRTIASAASRRLSRLVPWLIVATGMVATVGLVRELTDDERVQTDAAVERTAEAVAQVLNTGLTSRLKALDRMARRREISAYPTKATWDDDAARYIVDFPGYHALVWADAAHHARWAVFRDSTVPRVDSSWVAVCPPTALASPSRPPADVTDGGGRMLTSPATRVHGVSAGRPGDRWEVIACALVFRRIGPAGAPVPVGAIVGVIHVGELMDAVLSGDIANGYHVTVRDDAHVLYASRDSGDAAGRPRAMSRRALVAVGRVRWAVTVVPTPATLAALRSNAPVEVFIVGVLVTLLLARMVWLAEVARAGGMARASAEAQLRGFLDNTDDLIEVTTPTGALLYVNSAWRRTFGYEDSEPATDGSEARVVPEYAAAYRDWRERVLRGEPADVFESVFATRTGRRLVLSVRGTCRVEHGAPVAMRSVLRDVTAQRAAEEAQARLVATLEATTDFVGVANGRGRAEYINRAGRRMVGIGDDEDVTGIGLSGIYTPAARQYAIDVAIPAATRDGVWQGESVVRTRDGREIPVSQVVVAHQSARGGVWFVSTIMRDISAQKQREEELVVLNSASSAIGEAADAESAYRIAIRQLCEVTGWPYGEVWVVRPEGDAVIRNAVWHTDASGLAEFAAASAPFVYQRDEALPGRVWATGRPSWMRDVATESDSARAPMAVAAGLHAAVGVPVMAGDELVAVLTLHMRRLSDDDAHRVRLVAVVAAQLGTHILRKRAEQALRESEERFRRLSDASTDGIAVSLNGWFIDVNAAWVRLFGYTEDELTRIRAGDLVVPEDRELVTRHVAENQTVGYACICMRKDGSTFDAEVTATPTVYKGSAARVTVIRDITQWRRLDRLKSEFVSTVSHELRTPLTSIRGSLGLLEGGAAGGLSPQGFELVRIARGNAERLIRLINDMLDLDKIEAGKLELRPTTLMPADVVRAAVDGIRAMAEQFNIRLEEHVVAHRTFPGDRDRVVQVLTNLLSNAMKFSPSGSTVELSVLEIGTLPTALSGLDGARSRGVVRFAVENPGPGIAPADLGRLFTRFQQLDGSDTRRRGGTGLGLAISKAIVEQHGGTIGVQSEPDVRTTFWFELPLSSPTRVPWRSGVHALAAGAGSQG